MTFVVKIEAPGAGAAESAIGRVEGALAKTTTAADKTRDAMGRVVGTVADLTRLAAAAEKAAIATKHLATEEGVGTGVSAKLRRAHEERIDAIAREADIIERIRGPMREYRADMDALEALYKRNKISAAEYDDELQRLIKTQGTMHGPVQEQAKGAGGDGLGDVVKGFAGGDIAGALSGIPGAAALIGVAGAVREIASEYHALKDEYITLTNAAIKFVDASHSVDVVIDEQVALSTKLHTKLETTIDLYDAVRDGTDGLNVSHAEQNQLLKLLGESFILAGKGAENAGGLMQKFSYALASGKIESRELKGIMREVPEIADAWTTHFAMTRVELVKAVNSGKIGTEDLMQAMLAEGKVIEDNYGKRKITHAQLVADRDLRLSIAKQQSDERGDGSYTPSGDRFGNQQRQRDQAAKEYEEKARITALEGKRVEQAKLLGGELEKNAKIAEMADAAARAGISIGDFDQAAADTQSRVILFLKEFGVQADGTFTAAANRADLLNKEIEKLGESKAAEKLTEDVRRLYDTLHGVTDLVDAQKKHWDDLGRSINALQGISPSDKALVPGATFTRDDVDNIRSLRDKTLELDTATSQYGKTTVEVMTRINQHKDAISDLKGAYASGELKITFKEYTEALKALGVEESAAAKLLHEIQAPQKAFIVGTTALTLLLDQGKVSVAQYNAELTKLIGTFGGADLAKLLDFKTKEYKPDSQANAFAQDQARLEEEKIIQHKMADIDKQYSRPEDPDLAHDIETAKASEELKKRLDSKTFGGAFKDLNSDAKTFGQILAGEVNSGLDKLNDALITAAQGGKVAWGEMAESILADLERILLKELEVKAITGIIGAFGGAGAAGAAAAGGSEALGAAVEFAARSGPGAYPTLVGPGAAGGSASAGSGASSAAASTAPVFVNHIHNHINEKVTLGAISTRDGASSVLNVIRANGGAVRR